MNSYKVIGLNISTREGKSYSTVCPNNTRILYDKNKNSITKTHLFTIYKLYIQDEFVNAEVELYEDHIASFRGTLSTLGILEVNLTLPDVSEYITHVPSEPLFIEKFDLVHPNENIEVKMINDPNTCVFRYSAYGNDEKMPCGFAYVNASLFTKKNV